MSAGEDEDTTTHPSSERADGVSDRPGSGGSGGAELGAGKEKAASAEPPDAAASDEPVAGAAGESGGDEEGATATELKEIAGDAVRTAPPSLRIAS